MSADEQQSSGEPLGARPASGEPSEEELRAAYEAELSRLTSADLIAQAVVSLLNVGARRLGPIRRPDAAGSEGVGDSAERDLEQVRDAIDAVRPLLEILERRVPEGVRPLRDALAQLQMAYAREVQSGGTAAGGAGAPPSGDEPAPPNEEGEQSEPGPGEPGPAQRSGRLWVPGS